MLMLITPQNYERHRNDLADMYQFRTDKGKINQKKQDISPFSYERDSYDEGNAHYLIYKDPQETLKGCLRFIETVHPCLLDEPSSSAHSTVHDLRDFKRVNYWLVSHIFVDDYLDVSHLSQNHIILATLLAGFTLFGLEFSCECALFMTDIHTLKHAQNLGLTLAFLNDDNAEKSDIIYVAAYSPTHYCFDKLIKCTDIDSSRPILWVNSGWLKY